MSIYILDCLTCFDIHKCDYAWFNFESTGLSLWTCICNTSYFLSNMKCLLPARLRCSHSVNSLSLKAGKYVAKNDSLSQGLDTAKFNGLSWFIMVYHGLSWFIMVYHGLSWFIMVYHHVFHLNITIPQGYPILRYAVHMSPPFRPLTTKSCSPNEASARDWAGSSVSPWTEP